MKIIFIDYNFIQIMHGKPRNTVTETLEGAGICDFDGHISVIKQQILQQIGEIQEYQHYFHKIWQA
jgi:hypothetical protein